MCSFISCVKMDAYPDQHGPERKMIPVPYFYMLQAVIIQNPIIDSLTGSTFTVYRFVFFGVSWNAGLKTKIIMIFNIYHAVIITGRTGFCVRTGVNAATFIGTAVFMGVLSRVIAPRAHFMSFFAQRAKVQDLVFRHTLVFHPVSF